MSDRGGTQRPRMARQIVARLQSMIVDGHYPVGVELAAQRERADMLVVSRPSLREALSTLHTLGLLEVEHGRWFARAGDIAHASAALADGVLS